MSDETYKIIGDDGREYGPVTLAEIRDWIDDARVEGETRVWSSEDERWLRADQRQELKWSLPTHFAETPPVLSEMRSVAVGVPVRVLESTLMARRAGLMMRLAAIGCDYVLYSLTMTLLTAPWSDQIRDLQKSVYDQMGSPNADPKLMLELMKHLAIAVIPTSFLYYAALPMVMGTTPGKFIARLKVVRNDGSPLTWGAASLRWAAALGCAFTFGFGFLPLFFTPLRQGLHDLVAGTVVVQNQTEAN